MALTAEEVEKLKELKRTKEFKKNYKLIRDELVKKERQGADMTAKGLICFFVMCYVPRAGFHLAVILLFVLIIVPFLMSKRLMWRMCGTMIITTFTVRMRLLLESS